MTEDDREKPESHTDWLRWPPSPKTQIVLIALGFGLINIILIAIWAIALYINQ